MPFAGNAADISSDVCCDTFWLIGERVRTIAFDGVCACMDPSCIDREFVSYSTEGEIHSILGESLVITFLRARMVATGRDGKPLNTPITRLEYRLELRENGWPMAVRKDDSTETLVQEDWRLAYALSKHARGHGEKMWRALVNSVTTTDLAKMMFRPSLNEHIMNRGVSLGDLLPLANTGPQVGYRMDITVDTMLL